MKRNIKKAVNLGMKLCDTRKGLDLSQHDMCEFLSIYKENGGKDTSAAWWTASSAYYAGLAVGMRNSK